MHAEDEMRKQTREKKCDLMYSFVCYAEDSAPKTKLEATTTTKKLRTWPDEQFVNENRFVQAQSFSLQTLLSLLILYFMLFLFLLHEIMFLFEKRAQNWCLYAVELRGSRLDRVRTTAAGAARSWPDTFHSIEEQSAFFCWRSKWILSEHLVILYFVLCNDLRRNISQFKQSNCMLQSDWLF